MEKIGKDLEEKYGCEFIFKDYRSGNGTHKQGEVVRENSLYRQNYCGCIYALSHQREHQGKIMDEMFSPLSKQILPESIESKLELYKKRDELQVQGIPFKIIKQRFLNYRLLRGTVKVDKKIIPSYILCYSTLSKRKTSANIVYEKNEIFYLGKDEVKLLSLEIFNDIGNSSYKNVKSLIFNPPTFESELNIRDTITKNPYGLSAIIVVDEVIDGKYEIELDSVVYEDVKEVII